jgi:DNA-binding transcriptional LysR family regulator
MALRPAFDLELLRTLVFIAEEASFTKAAERIGRTQSAVTLQIQKLEGQIGRPLVVRSKGGPVELTPEGRSLVEHARKMLELNDNAFRDLTAAEALKKLRLGAPDYFNRFYLDHAISDLHQSYPNVFVEVFEGRTCQLFPLIKEDAFDLVLGESIQQPKGFEAIDVWKGPFRWVTSTTDPIHLRDPLPLSLYPSECPWRPSWMEDCSWRSATLSTLRQARREYRVANIAETEEGHFACVLAGQAVTITLHSDVPAGLRVAGEQDGLPALPDVRMGVIRGRKALQPATDQFIEFIRSSFHVP